MLAGTRATATPQLQEEPLLLLCHQLLTHPEHRMASRGDLAGFFSPLQLVSKPRKWLVEPTWGLIKIWSWVPKRAPAACTSPQPPPAALPNPAGLPRLLPCWVFTPAAISSATLHRGVRKTQLEKPSFWRAKRIIAWKPCRRVPGKETPRSTSLKSISPCTCTRGLRVGWKASFQADSCSTGNASLKTVVSQALSQHSHRAKRWRRELGEHSPLAVVQSSCEGS